jgi:hypothetical protein
VPLHLPGRLPPTPASGENDQRELAQRGRWLPNRDCRSGAFTEEEASVAVASSRGISTRGALSKRVNLGHVRRSLATRRPGGWVRKATLLRERTSRARASTEAKDSPEGGCAAEDGRRGDSIARTSNKPSNKPGKSKLTAERATLDPSSSNVRTGADRDDNQDGGRYCDGRSDA